MAAQLEQLVSISPPSKRPPGAPIIVHRQMQSLRAHWSGIGISMGSVYHYEKQSLLCCKTGQAAHIHHRRITNSLHHLTRLTTVLLKIIHCAIVPLFLSLRLRL